MKTSLFSLLTVVTVIGFVSCKKETDPPPPPPPPPDPTSRLVRIQQGIDADLSNDTVYLLSYNQAGTISSLIDSVNGYLLTATYDTAGRLEDISEDYTNAASYTYDINGLLTAINFTIAGSREKYLFTYSNGVVSKKSHYSDFGSGGAQSLWREYIYTVNGGNITTIKEYNAGATLLNTENFTYGAHTNIFKNLALFNCENILGTENLINFETYFNKNLVTGMSSSARNITNAFTLNAEQQLSKAVSTENPGHVFTWQFSYQEF